ncbi:serine hydrolase domain-containing protein [Terriglobus tenax]|uniref:serine hydrolase domain-containing protein n=1 Tax=Terriglobus tenax TaxID=1111115 RepID=UPI0021DF97E0|nr:serine hydrolase domain-containing protein [Terriglobus tenax]
MKRSAIAIVSAWMLSGALYAQEISPELKQTVDEAAQRVLRETGVPSASIGIVKDGVVVYTTAFGKSRLDINADAMPEMPYAIGSISKQFTAACILLLQEDGKLKLDDPVAKWFPELTRAKDITLRNLLTHTSGYSDYAPQDYTIPEWTKPGDPLKLVRTWAGKPLDFEPGTKWQYSNTNFVLAGLIVEKASGMKFAEFRRTRILVPLKMTHVLDLNTDAAQMKVGGYFRNALAPLRKATLEAPGWYFADGDLAMPVEDLLTWDMSVMNQTLLKPESYRELETNFKLKDGSEANYGLGIGVSVRSGHRVVSHTGEVGGFVAANAVFPEDKIAIAVLTNQEASSAASSIQRAIATAMIPGLAKTATVGPEAQAKTVLGGLQQGKIDRTLFTDNANFYFDKDAMDDFQTSLSPLGEIKTVVKSSESLRGGMTFRAFTVTFANGKEVTLTTFTTKDGKLEQFLIEP